MENKKIYLAILNISSYCGLCSDAEHLYGSLILSTKENVNINNLEDWNVKYLGENIEIRRPLTIELAIKLDEKDGGNINQRKFKMIEEYPDYFNDYSNSTTTSRFETFDQVVEAGINKWKELNLDCPFISLYEGKKYYSNN